MDKVVSFIRAHKRLLLVFVVILLFFLMRALLLQKPDTELTYTVKQENLVDTVQVSGTYTTASQTQVTSPTNGIITRIFVTNNQEVQKGDPLFHVESTATVSQQKAAYATYQSALSALQTAQNTKKSLDAAMWTKQKAYIDAQNNYNYKNQKKDYTAPSKEKDYNELEKQSIDIALTQTQKDFAAGEQAYRTADSAVVAASAQVDAAKQLYAETQSTTITAPTFGTIVNLLVKEGNQVAASQLQPTTAVSQVVSAASVQQPVLIIANLGDPYIAVNVSEDYATRVIPGQKVSIIFDALKSQTFEGRVMDIATVGTNVQGVVTYSARISAEAVSTVIKPNMTALLTIETLRRDSVITVPNTAIVTNEGQTYVIEAKTHKHIPVKLGTKGVAKIEVTEGLDAGIVIVANPNIE